MPDMKHEQVPPIERSKDTTKTPSPIDTFNNPETFGEAISPDAVDAAPYEAEKPFDPTTEIMVQIPETSPRRAHMIGGKVYHRSSGWYAAPRVQLAAFLHEPLVEYRVGLDPRVVALRVFTVLDTPQAAERLEAARAAHKERLRIEAENAGGEGVRPSEGGAGTALRPRRN